MHALCQPGQDSSSLRPSLHPLLHPLAPFVLTPIPWCLTQTRDHKLAPHIHAMTAFPLASSRVTALASFCLIRPQISSFSSQSLTSKLPALPVGVTSNLHLSLTPPCPSLLRPTNVSQKFASCVLRLPASQGPMIIQALPVHLQGSLPLPSPFPPPCPVFIFRLCSLTCI